MLLRESLFGGSRQSSKYLVRINKSVINIYFGRLIITLPQNTMNLSSPGPRALCKDKVLPRPERRRVQQQKRRQLGPWGGTAHTHLSTYPDLAAAAALHNGNGSNGRTLQCAAPHQNKAEAGLQQLQSTLPKELFRHQGLPFKASGLLPPCTHLWSAESFS